ncbi:hypothetical protein ABGB18_05540 [Nonomuraea sp. B12E4]|uniref:hypothetical protein n=1 Tax=Nonomuraea sp. B12E4 TaxID=3153564 RepID=UPI00325E3CAB
MRILAGGLDLTGTATPAGELTRVPDARDLPTRCHPGTRAHRHLVAPRVAGPAAPAVRVPFRRAA